MSKFQEIVVGVLTIGFVALILYSETKNTVQIGRNHPNYDYTRRHLRDALDELKARDVEECFFASSHYERAEAYYSRYIISPSKDTAEQCLYCIERARHHLNFFG